MQVLLSISNICWDTDGEIEARKRHYYPKSKLFGYIDKYNSGLLDSDYKKYADEHLKKIISANRNNKSIHDIITSIQQNQYKIMTEDFRNIFLLWDVQARVKR